MKKQKLRIAFVDYVLEPDKPGRSGLSDVAWDMASELQNQGHEPHIIAAYHTTTYPDSRVIVHSFPTPPMGYRNLVGNFWLLKRAAQVIQQIQPDIVHAPEYISTAFLAQLGVKTPLVLTVPGNIFHRIREGHDFEWYFVQVLKWAAVKSSRECASIIAISQEMKRWWEFSGSPPERTPWIPYGVNTERFFQVPNARERVGIPPDQLFLLYVGRFSKEKGLLDLLNALALIKPRLDPSRVQVLLIGRGAQEQELTQTIEQHAFSDIVKTRTWVAQEELSTWYSAADALLLPSHSEGFSRTIPEAMCCGTPVIGSLITGTEDHVHDYLNGILFRVRDVPALARVLDLVIAYPEILRRMRPKTMDYAKQNLTWKRVMERIVEEVYQPIVSAR